MQNFLKGSRKLDSPLFKRNETGFETLSLEKLRGCALPVDVPARKDPRIEFERREPPGLHVTRHEPRPPKGVVDHSECFYTMSLTIIKIAPRGLEFLLVRPQSTAEPWFT